MDTQKVWGLALSKKVLPKLRSLKHQDWRLTIILYESGFCLTTDYEQIWLRPDQEPPERPKCMIQDETITGSATTTESLMRENIPKCGEPSILQFLMSTRGLSRIAIPDHRDLAISIELISLLEPSEMAIAGKIVTLNLLVSMTTSD
jgi:hypothetical protein